MQLSRMRPSTMLPSKVFRPSLLRHRNSRPSERFQLLFRLLLRLFLQLFVAVSACNSDCYSGSFSTFRHLFQLLFPLRFRLLLWLLLRLSIPISRFRLCLLASYLTRVFKTFRGTGDFFRRGVVSGF